MTTLEDEFDNLLATAYLAAYGKEPTSEWRLAMSLRAGTQGPVATLDEAGSAIGITRERVRQVMKAVQHHLDGAEVPHLAEAAQVIVDHSPVAEPIGLTLSRAGLARADFTGEGLLNIFKLIGQSPRDVVGTDLVRVDDWLVEESEVPVMQSASVARRHTSSFGMTTAEEIRQALSTPENPLDRKDVRRVLRAEPTVKWAGDWLWVEKPDNMHANRLINTARSILSVNAPQTVTSIHDGARRVWKFRKLDILPPASAMKEFFEQSPYFSVDGDLVSPIQPLDYHEVLGDVTGMMIDVLKASEYQVMDRYSLEDACKEAGIAKGTYGVWTTYAEWMQRFGPQVWGLRGSNPNPAAVQEISRAAKARSKAEPRRKAWSWTGDGGIVQTMDLTTSNMSSAVLSLEAGRLKLIEKGPINVYSADLLVGVIKTWGGTSWGWHSTLRAIGARKGDVLQIRLNIAERRADVRLGGQEFWT